MTTVFNTRSLAVVILALVVFLGAFRPVSAQELNPLLNAVHKFRLQNYLAINAYYNYSASRSPQTLNEIVTAVNEANGHMQAISELRGEILPEEAYQTLATYFQDFKRLMNTNVTDVREKGYPDLRLVSELAEKTSELNKMGEELYNIAAEESARGDLEQVELAREAALLIAQMMSQYSVFSTSSVSQIFQGDSDTAPMDVKARELDAMMVELDALQTNAEAQTMLTSAKSTWDFIRGSYINYNERNVSFVINRYSKAIIAELESAIPVMGNS